MTPETIPLLALPWLPLEQRRALPSDKCVYFVLDEESCVVYIGRTGNLRQRFINHHHFRQFKARNGCRIAWVLVSDSALLRSVEAACIAYFQPALNNTDAYAGSGFTQVTLRLSDEMYAWVKWLAKAERRSIRQQLIVALEERQRQETMHAG